MRRSSNVLIISSFCSTQSNLKPGTTDQHLTANAYVPFREYSLEIQTDKKKKTLDFFTIVNRDEAPSTFLVYSIKR